jgi:hypothetical protein
MSPEQAVETCAKAMLKRRKYSEEKWRDYPNIVDLAEDLIAALGALGLLRQAD